MTAAVTGTFCSASGRDALGLARRRSPETTQARRGASPRRWLGSHLAGGHRLRRGERTSSLATSFALGFHAAREVWCMEFPTWLIELRRTEIVDVLRNDHRTRGENLLGLD